MSDPTTRIIISAKDQTSAAFSSVNSGLIGLSTKAVAASAALSAIGAGALVGSMAAFTKQTLDAQDALFKLSQKTGIAVESLAGLEFAAEQSGVEIDKVAKATRAFSLLVAEAADESGEAAKQLRQLGLSYKDLKDLSPEQRIIALTEALSKFSKEDRPAALISILGQKMADLIPLMSGSAKGLQDLIDQGKKLNPVTEASAKQAERFNDQLNLLNKSVSAVGRELVQGMIPGLTRVSDAMVKATQDSGFFAGALAGVKQLFTETFGNPKILGDVGNIRREILKTKDAIANLSGKKDSIFFDQNALEHEKEKLVALESELQVAIGKSRDVIAAQDSLTESTKKFTIELDKPAEKLGKVTSAQDLLKKAQTESLRVEEEYIKLLQIERKAREDLLKPYQDSADSAVKRVTAMLEENEALELSQREQISLAHAIELTTIARLEEKKAITTDSGAVEEIEKEIAARQKMIVLIQGRDAKDAGDKVRKAELGAYEQFATQAARNIQSQLAFGIQAGFKNGFKDGVKGLLVGIADTVSRMVSEVLAAKLLGATGFGSSLFGGGIGGTGGSSGGLGNILNLGSSALRGGSLLGGLGSFGAGASGAASAGVFGAGGSAYLGGAGTALGGTAATEFGALATAGAGFSALAAPVAALAAGFLGAKALAGDKKIAGIGGTEAALIGTALGGPIGAVVGGAILKLFGHGPLKFRQQSLQGDVSSQGFDGDLTNVFRAKGGLLVGNKHKSQSEQLSEELENTLDTTLKNFYKAGNEFAKNLGLSTALVDTFTTEIQIKSEKGKTITAEAVGTMLTGISNQLAERLLPTVATFKKTGEDSATTLTRLNTEFVALDSAAQLLGASVDYAKQLVGDMGIAARTAFVDQAGGVEALGEKSAYFFNNFLDKAEQVPLMVASLGDSLTALGQPIDLSKEAFKELVQAAWTSNELRIGLLDLEEQFLTTRNAATDFKNSIDQTTLALAEQFAPDEVLPLKFKAANDALSKFGLTADISKEKFSGLLKEFVKSGGLFTSVAGDVVNASRLFLDYQNSIPVPEDNRISDVNSAFEILQKAVDTERTRLTKNYNDSLTKVNDQITNVTGNIERLRTLSDALKSTLDTINPISLSDARAQVSGAISSGNVDLESIRPALDKLTQKDTSGFSDRNSFLRSQAVSSSLVTKLQGSTTKQLSVAEQTKKALEDTRDNLTRDFEAQLGRLDLMVAAAQDEANAIAGLSKAVLSLVDALGGFNRAVSNAGGSPISSGGTVGGNSSISSKDIIGFANTHTPLQTYKEAIKRGVSSDQIVASGKYTRAEIDKFVKDNKLPSFDVGGIVPKTSLALVHKGERVINPQQNEAIVILLQEQGLAMKEIMGIVRSMYSIQKNVVNVDGKSINTRTAA